MFKSLVEPILLYGSEVTGYGNLELLEKVQRRYFKWILGLPKSTRNPIIMAEADALPIATLAMSRAVKYECSIPGRACRTLVVALHEEFNQAWNHTAKTTRRQRFERLGWSQSEADRRISMFPLFWTEAWQRATDIWEQEIRSQVKAIPWFVPAINGLPGYLRNNNENLKIIARFRCGAETTGGASWKRDRICRVCQLDEESEDHVMACVPDENGRCWKELTEESGQGIRWMKRVLRKRSGD
jgi:hypothetical protein